MSTVQLLQGDCLDLMKSLPDGSVDACVTDPPYGVNFKYATHNDTPIGYEDWCRAWFTELRRIVRHAIVFTPGTRALPMWMRIAEPNWLLCWWKPACMGVSPVGFCNWEPMLMYGKAGRPRGTDVVRAPIIANDKLNGHPCPKPEQWGIKTVELVSDPGATVLDPFMGSGTTGVACVRTGRNFIGFELDEQYFSTAQTRINDEIAKQAEALPI